MNFKIVIFRQSFGRDQLDKCPHKLDGSCSRRHSNKISFSVLFAIVGSSATLGEREP